MHVHDRLATREIHVHNQQGFENPIESTPGPVESAPDQLLGSLVCSCSGAQVGNPVETTAGPIESTPGQLSSSLLQALAHWCVILVGGMVHAPTGCAGRMCELPEEF